MPQNILYASQDKEIAASSEKDRNRTHMCIPTHPPTHTHAHVCFKGKLRLRGVKMFCNVYKLDTKV